MKISDVTIIIPTRNEEANIKDCIISAKNFEKIIIIDSESTDNTLKIAKEFGAELINFKWNKNFPKKRNWFLDYYGSRINSKWVLFLDADERITNEFVNELKVQIEKGFDAFILNYENYFMRKKMKHGIKQRKIALFKNGNIRYERIETKRFSSLDMEIHEHPQNFKKLGEIKSPLKHFDYKGIECFIKKHIDYAAWEAERFLLIKNNTKNNFTLRQSIKYKLLSTNIFPVIYFFLDYLLLLRILDGIAGLKYSFYKMTYFSIIADIIKENRDKY